MLVTLFVIVALETLFILWCLKMLIWSKADGTIVITETDDKKTLSLELDSDPDKLDQKKHVVFKVEKLSDE